MNDRQWYTLWYGIRHKCLSPVDPDYHNYGGRGITMYKFWIDSLENFVHDITIEIGDRPDGLTLDRRDNNKGYEPGNLRWTTTSQQNLNRRLLPNNTGHRYICQISDHQYVVTIRAADGGKRIFRKYCKSLDEAIAARDGFLNSKSSIHKALT